MQKKAKERRTPTSRTCGMEKARGKAKAKARARQHKVNGPKERAKARASTEYQKDSQAE